MITSRACLLDARKSMYPGVAIDGFVIGRVLLAVVFWRDDLMPIDCFALP